MKVKCANCGWTGSDEEVGEIRDLFMRVPPGDTMPAGECPKCRALSYPETARLVLERNGEEVGAFDLSEFDWEPETVRSLFEWLDATLAREVARP